MNRYYSDRLTKAGLIVEEYAAASEDPAIAALLREAQERIVTAIVRLNEHERNEMARLFGPKGNE